MIPPWQGRPNSQFSGIYFGNEFENRFQKEGGRLKEFRGIVKAHFGKSYPLFALVIAFPLA